MKKLEKSVLENSGKNKFYFESDLLKLNSNKAMKSLIGKVF